MWMYVPLDRPCHIHTYTHRIYTRPYTHMHKNCTSIEEKHIHMSKKNIAYLRAPERMPRDHDVLRLVLHHLLLMDVFEEKSTGRPVNQPIISSIHPFIRPSTIHTHTKNT